jgi:hypothetical protein
MPAAAKRSNAASVAVDELAQAAVVVDRARARATGDEELEPSPAS